jgi:hypothetical protein
MEYYVLELFRGNNKYFASILGEIRKQSVEVFA